MWNVGGKEITLPGHLNGNGISNARLSPDGKIIVSIANNGDILFWRDGRQITRKSSLDTIVENLEFSPDSELVALVEKNKVQLWKSNGTYIGSFSKQSNEIKRIVFSPDSKVIALIEKNKVQLWQSDGKFIGNLPGHTNQVESVIFSPDSELILTIGDDNLAKLSLRNGGLINVLKGHVNKIQSIKFSPNGQMIVSVNTTKGKSRGAIKLWNRSGNLITTFDGQSVEEVKFSRSNQIVAGINNDAMSIQIWDVQGKQLSSLPHNGRVTDFKFDLDDRSLISSSDDHTVRLWRLDETSPKPKILRGHSASVIQVILNPADGKTIASMSKDGMIRLWKRDGTALKILHPASKDDNSERDNSENHINFSDDGQVIIFDGFIYKDEKPSYSVQFWSNDGVKLKELKGASEFDQITFSADKKNVAWIDPYKSFNLWDFAGNLKANFSGHPDTINDVVSSPNRKFLASASDDKSIKLWSSEGKFLHQLGHGDKVNSLSFSADNRILASASDDNTVKLWNYEGKLLKTIAHPNKVKVVLFNPVSNILASVSDDKIVRLWTQEGQSLFQPIVHTDKVNNIRFSPDGKSLVSVTQGGTAKLWQSSDGNKLLEPINNAGATVFHPDSSILATTRTLSVPNALWVPNVSFSGGDGADMQFSPDRTMLATIAGEEISILDFDVDRALIKACGLARSYLKNNAKVKDDDRKLCDDIPIQR